MIAGTGVDIVEIARVKDAVERWGDRFLQRVFTDGEVAYCMSKKNPYPHLAARFAAKEAVIKALSVAGVLLRSFPPAGADPEETWASPAITAHAKEIEVVNDSSGRPSVRLSRTIAPRDGGKGAVTAHITISHERRYAIASVVLEMY